MAKILLVDDEADMRLALKNVLSGEGHEVFEASEGSAALSRIQNDPPDLVLLDIRLPGMDGIEILRKVREFNQTLPVVMVTGYGSVDSAVEVMQLGASHYLAKPFSNKDLLETVNAVLQPSSEAAGILRQRLAQKISPALAEPDVSPVSAKRLPLRFIGAVAVAAVLAWGLRAWRSSESNVFPVPYSHPTALVWVGESLWSADWFNQSVYEHRLRGNRLEVVRTVRLPQSHITGLAVANGSLYLTDSWKKTIERRRLDPGLTLIDTTPSPGKSPSGLYWDGRYLWSSDSAAGRFYQHDLDRPLSVLASYKSPGKSPAGVYRDAQYFWSADSDTRTLYQHRLDQELRVVAQFTLAALDEGSAALSCFTWREGRLWMGRDGAPRLMRRSLSAFRKTIP